jgi:predicted nucleotidyltransferase
MDLHIFENIRTLKRQLLPNDNMILFGSQARGDARFESDWDLLILLNKDKITYEDENKYAYPLADMGWDNGVYISVKIYTSKEWQNHSFTSFYYNVQKDGIIIT